MNTKNSELSYGGFWRRLGATLIDTIVMIIVFSVPVSLYYGDSYWDSEGFAGVFDFLMTFVLPIVISIWMWIRFAATPGKMALNLRIVNAHTGENISTGQAIIRYLGYIVSGLPLGLGFLWIAFDQRKRGWHDMIAGTVVIKQAPQVVSFDSASKNNG
jgi:uncharacterized RDD family membrane protein YckC